MAALFTCTACAVTFVDSEAHKIHYRLDWHRYNLRRKVAGLASVNQDDFDRRLAAVSGTGAPKAEFQGRCKECRKIFRSEGLYNQHLQSKKHKDTIKAAAAAVTTRTTASPPTEGDSLPPPPPTQAAEGVSSGATGGGSAPASSAENAAEHMTVQPRVTPLPLSTMAKAPVKWKGDDMEEEEYDDDYDEEEEEEEEEEKVAPPKMGRVVCIFCDEEAENFEQNCAHMLHAHGFFIPDVEYLTDPEGLVGYVEEKVKLGHICLYCNGKGKTFHTCRSLQQHMTDSAHCKLLYEEGEDLHEYENFYDFSASYSDAEKRGLIKNAAGEAFAADTDDDQVERRNGSEEDSDDYVEVSRTLGVTDLGELVLIDGKTVGNRQWNRYYRQRLRTPDEREVVVAHRRATRLSLGAMYDAEVNKGTSTGGAVSLQRGQRKAYGGLAGVSCPKDVKMLRAHQRRQAREHLKTGLKQNKLNKTFDRVADM